MKLTCLVFSIATLFAWGLWGFYPALAQKHVSVASVALFQGVGAAIAFAPALLVGQVGGLPDFKIEFAWRGFAFAALAGLLAAVGTFTYQFALKHGNVSQVGPVTAMYPVITAMAGALFLRERLTPIQIVGIALAVTAVICMAQSEKA